MPRSAQAPAHTTNGHVRGAGVRVQDLLDETAVTSVAVGGLTVSVSYRVLWEEQGSDEDWARIKTLNGRPYLLEVIPLLVVRWDLMDADGGGYLAPTRESIESAKVPTRFLGLLEAAVMQASALGKGNSGTSGDSFQPAAASE